MSGMSINRNVPLPERLDLWYTNLGGYRQFVRLIQGSSLPTQELVIEVARYFNVSERTAYRWLDEHKKIDGLYKVGEKKG